MTDDKALVDAYSSIYKKKEEIKEEAQQLDEAIPLAIPALMKGAGLAMKALKIGRKVNQGVQVARGLMNTIKGEKQMQTAGHEPEGEMIDEMKAPRMQKGAMAYDGPNKERSEAADRILAKTKAKRKKRKEEVEQIDELKKKTMGSYIAKASKHLADRRFDQGDSEKRKYEPDEADEKEDK